jgi:hypothetical protein
MTACSTLNDRCATEENLTDVVMKRWKDIPDLRLRQIMQSLIKHLHGFVRDIEPTQAEWAVAVHWLARTGQQCPEKRQEFILSSDVLGVSMLVDAINLSQFCRPPMSRFNDRFRGLRDGYHF